MKEGSRSVRWSTNLIPFGPCPDKFGPSGYRENRSTLERIQAAGKVKGLDGVELHYPDMFEGLSLHTIRKALSDYQLECSIITPTLAGTRWRGGALTNSDPKVRQQAIDVIRAAMDVAHEIGADKINLWPGRDGHDYPFQVDHRFVWDCLVAGVRTCAEHDPEVKVCLEYKLKEPRTHVALGTIGKILLIINEVNLPNVGGLLDVGHALMAYESPAESAMLLHRYGKLFHTHFNDNYADWDWDMIAGSVHFAHYLELVFWLAEIGYDGWYSLDLYPTGVDPVQACELSIASINDFIRVIRAADRDALLEAITKQDAVAAQRLVKKALGMISLAC
ncbi:MAG: sugar phosphate isomerase/epimerase family protein [Bacillota bacterium]